MKLVIIGGPTATGKTTLARKLAKDLQIPTFLRDDYKEREYDLINERPRLKDLARIDKASRQELYKVIEQAGTQDESLIVESNFTYTEGRKIKDLLRPNMVIVEIFCYARGFTILKRYIRRNKTGLRHSGHRDYLWYSIVAVEALGPGRVRYRPLKLSAHLLKVNTNNFTKVDYEAVRQFIHNTS